MANVAVPLTVRTSPATRSSAYVTEELTVRSYVLFGAVIVTDRGRAVMLAVPVVLVFWL